MVHTTFQSACKALGLLESDKHWDDTMKEASLCRSPFSLRELFAVMLLFCQLTDASILWDKYKDSLSEDIRRRVHLDQQQINNLLIKEIYNEGLVCLEETVLSLGGQRLEHYGLPQPIRRETILQNKQYLKEISYDKTTLASKVFSKENSLNDEQFQVYTQILDSIEQGSGSIFFLDAPGGTGKTFVLNLLLAKVRKDHGIALAVASSGIAATLLDGGKTAHSTFKLPLNLMLVETPTCHISKQSDMAQILKECKLIVWDECTMTHKGGFEALNRTLKDIRGTDCLMGGTTVLLAGDFRQTLPVVQRGTRADITNSCLKASYLWPHVQTISLNKNMRVHLRGDYSAGIFAELLLKIGDGDYPFQEGKINIQSDLGTVVTSLSELIAKIYPFIKNIKEKSIEWLCERAILTPKNDKAAAINATLLKLFDGEEIEYRSFDSVVQMDDAVHYPIEFLNSLNPSGMPSHRLHLKVGAPIMLLKNLNPPKQCNGTRLQVKVLHKNVVEATVITGCARGESVFIPRIPSFSTDYPFEFKRVQFPLKVSFAMTINKAQGQSLKVAGIDLTEDCFSHGQFYVACSRVSSSRGLFILAPEGKTTNVVYKEILR